MDLSVKPGDNFILYANGTWLKNNHILAAKTRWESFNKLIEDTAKMLHLLLEDAAKNAGSDSKLRKVGDFFKKVVLILQCSKSWDMIR